MSQFGGSPPSNFGPSNDDYGFFTAPTSSASTSQFGTADTAPPQFGTPTGFGATHSAHYAPPTSAKATKNPVLLAGGALLLIAVLVVGGWFGWQVYQRNKAITIPSTLSGLPQSNDPEIVKGVDQALSQLKSSESFTSVDGAGYGQGDRLALLVIGRGDISESADLADLQQNFAAGKVLSPVQIGNNVCGSVTQLGVAFCVRTSSTMFGEVVLLSGTAPEASAALDDAWAAQ